MSGMETGSALAWVRPPWHDCIHTNAEHSLNRHTLCTHITLTELSFVAPDVNRFHQRAIIIISHSIAQKHRLIPVLDDLTNSDFFYFFVLQNYMVFINRHQLASSRLWNHYATARYRYYTHSLPWHNAKIQILSHGKSAEDCGFLFYERWLWIEMDSHCVKWESARNTNKQTDAHCYLWLWDVGHFQYVNYKTHFQFSCENMCSEGTVPLQTPHFLPHCTFTFWHTCTETQIY